MSPYGGSATDTMGVAFYSEAIGWAWQKEELMASIIIPGTCGACVHYCEGVCQPANTTQFSAQRMWSTGCVPCNGYRRSAVMGAPVDPQALAAVCRGN